MRPEGWEELLTKHLNILTERKAGSIIPEFDRDYAEAGADAMLEGLKKQGKYNTGYGTTDFPSARKGWFVFIPEEKE